MRNKFKYILTLLIIIFLFFILFNFTNVFISKTIFNENFISGTNNSNNEFNYTSKIFNFDNFSIGEVVGVSIKNNGNLLFLHRAENNFNSKTIISQNTIIEINTTSGDVVNSFGDYLFVAPHGLFVDKDDNIWITDTQLNKVFKFNSDGDLKLIIGEDYTFGLDFLFLIRNKFHGIDYILDLFYNDYIFARPTNVFVNSIGDILVSDGYRNSRIVKFSPSGELIWELDRYGSKDGEFNLVHGVYGDKFDNIYVVDRSNSRIQVFSNDGEFIKIIGDKYVQRPFSLVIKNDLLYIVDGGDYLNGGTENLISQIVILTLDGELVTSFGSFGNNDFEFILPHDIAVDDLGNIFVAEVTNKRIQGFYK